MPSLLQPADFEAIFENLPGLCLILDPSFRIMAQNKAHARATNTVTEDIIGRLLFEVYPDNPDDPNADGLARLRRSLISVIKNRKADTLPNLRSDIPRRLEEGGGFEPRYWRVVNTPVLGEDGFVRLIINRVEDLTTRIE